MSFEFYTASNGKSFVDTDSYDYATFTGNILKAMRWASLDNVKESLQYIQSRQEEFEDFKIVKVNMNIKISDI